MWHGLRGFLMYEEDSFGKRLWDTSMRLLPYVTLITIVILYRKDVNNFKGIVKAYESNNEQLVLSNKELADSLEIMNRLILQKSDSLAFYKGRIYALDNQKQMDD